MNISAEVEEGTGEDTEEEVEEDTGKEVEEESETKAEGEAGTCEVMCQTDLTSDDIESL